jgi:hypothetical protein
MGDAGNPQGQQPAKSALDDVEQLAHRTSTSRRSAVTGAVYSGRVSRPGAAALTSAIAALDWRWAERQREAAPPTAICGVEARKARHPANLASTNRDGAWSPESSKGEAREESPDGPCEPFQNPCHLLSGS